MKELSVRQFLKAFQELCENNERCYGCILANENYDCYLLQKTNIKKTLEIISDNTKTRKEDILEKYPETKLNNIGIPNFCVHSLGMNSICTKTKSCLDCWNERV